MRTCLTEPSLHRSRASTSVALHPPQSLQNVADHVLVGVELGDLVADVLVQGIAEQLQLGPIRAENGPVRPHPVERAPWNSRTDRRARAHADGVAPRTVVVAARWWPAPLQRPAAAGRPGRELPVMRTGDDEATVSVVAETGHGQVQRSVPERVRDSAGVFTSAAAVHEAFDASSEFPCVGGRERSLRRGRRFDRGTPAQAADTDIHERQRHRAAELDAQSLGDLTEVAWAPDRGNRADSAVNSRTYRRRARASSEADCVMSIDTFPPNDRPRGGLPDVSTPAVPNKPLRARKGERFSHRRRRVYSTRAPASPSGRARDSRGAQPVRVVRASKAARGKPADRTCGWGSRSASGPKTLRHLSQRGRSQARGRQ